MADLREMIAALSQTVPLPTGINTATTAMGIDAAGDVLVYVPPNVEEFQAEGAPFLSLSGGTMTGPLILAGPPTQPLEAASKAYVDAILNNPNLTGIVTVPTLPPTTSNNQAASTAFVHAAIAAGGTFVDAPADGFAYGRLNNNWAQVLPLAGGTLSGNLRIDGPAGTDRSIVYSTNYVARWQLDNTRYPETGNNSGSGFSLYAFADNGSFIGQALGADRATGPNGLGQPYLYLSPWRQSGTAGSFPGSVVGNRQDIVGLQGANVPSPLPNDPLSVTAGSPTITVNWPGSGTNNYVQPWQGGNDTYVQLRGATAVGGITPTGWLRVQTVPDGDHFTVTWTANATDTATGGGNAVTVETLNNTVLNRVLSATAAVGNGFPNQTSELWECAPALFPAPNTSLPRYTHRWHWTVGPNDPAGAMQYNLAGIEWDLTKRGQDYGYQPNIYRANAPTIGFWVGPTIVPVWVTSGPGTPVNWDTVYTVYSGQSDEYTQGVYNAFSTQPNSLVGQKFDPTGHGGVGVDIFGSYSDAYNFNPFHTTVNSAVVTIQMQWTSDLFNLSNGDQVFIPDVYTFNGVTFGGGIYPMSAVNAANATFNITGSGLATATGSGGPRPILVEFLPFAPYAPFQTWGMFQHGIITTPTTYFLSGAIIETQPGNAIQWSDGLGNASVTAATIAPGAIDLVLNASNAILANGPFVTSGLNPIQAGQPGGGNSVLLRPGAMGTGYADVAASGIDNNVDLRLVAEGTGTIRMMSPVSFVAGLTSDLTMRTGQVVSWTDGTGTATIGGTATTAGNLDITLTPAGTGRVAINNHALAIVSPPTPAALVIDQSATTGWAQVQFNLNPANNNAARLFSQRGGVGRWNLFVGDTDPESGSSSGTNFQIQGVLDNGTTIAGTPALKIIRATNQVNMGGALNVTGAGTFGGLTSNGNILVTGTNRLQVGQPGAGNVISLTPGQPGTNIADVAVSGIDTNIDLRLIASGTGQVRSMSPLVMAAGQGITGNSITLSGVVNALNLATNTQIRWSDGTNVSSLSGASGANADFSVSLPGLGRFSIANNLLLWGGANLGEAFVDIRNAAGIAKTIYFRTSTATRWNISSGAGAESGANAGSDFTIGRFADNGVFLGNPISIIRATGNITFSNSIGINGAVPPARPAITGSRTDGSALASLLAALVSYGMVTDTTTP